MSANQNKPVKKIIDGRIAAAIWKNEPKKQGGKPFYSVTFSRSFQDDQNNWKDTDSFSGTDLLIVGRLSVRAYDAISHLRASDRAADQADAA